MHMREIAVHAGDIGVHAQHCHWRAATLGSVFVTIREDGMPGDDAEAWSGDAGRGLIAFIPGHWMRPGSWARWQILFDRNGYDSVVIGEVPPGPAATAVHSRSDRPRTLGLGSLLANSSAELSRLTGTPILIGQGTGGFVAQVLLDQPNIAMAAIAVSPVRAGWVTRTWAAFAMRAPGRSRPPGDRPPLLLISGGKDLIAPESTVRSWERYGRRRHPDSVTDHHVFPDRGHSLAVDAGADQVINYCLDWLSTQNL